VKALSLSPGPWLGWRDHFRPKHIRGGGIFAGLKRKLLAGESFFQNEYTANAAGAKITFAPPQPGSVLGVALSGAGLILEKGAYVASQGNVECDAKWEGLKGFFNEGLFALRVTGEGTLFFGGYGDIECVDIDGEYTIDNGHAVAWEPQLDYRVTRAKRIRSFLFSDQLLLRFSGKGKIYVQSRSPVALANWVHPFRRVQKNSD